MSAPMKDRFWNRMRQFFALIGFLSLLVLVAGFAGAFHPGLDTLALLRPVALVLAVLCLFAFRSGLLRFVTAVVCGFALASVVVTVLPGDDSDGDIVIYSKNVLWSNAAFDGLVEDILSTDADAVLLQEVTDQNLDLLAQLSADYPHQHLCQTEHFMKSAILSKRPLAADAKCVDGRSVAAARINVDGEQVWLVSAHLLWPWPYSGSNDDVAIASFLDSLYGPIILAGDFNRFAWTHRVNQIAKMTKTDLAGPVLPSLALTFDTRSLESLPIDMALAPGGGRLERRGYFGSDHRGILAHLSLTK